jgi:hypothetical protein
VVPSIGIVHNRAELGLFVAGLLAGRRPGGCRRRPVVARAARAAALRRLGRESS